VVEQPRVDNPISYRDRDRVRRPARSVVVGGWVEFVERITPTAATSTVAGGSYCGTGGPTPSSYSRKRSRFCREFDAVGGATGRAKKTTMLIVAGPGYGPVAVNASQLPVPNSGTPSPQLHR
jgi:hypothetical protein